MSNPFCHVELGTDAPEKAKDFYRALFSWDFEEAPSPVPGGKYTHIKAGEGPGGGLMKKGNPKAPNAWMPYVRVDSIDASLAKARELGATVVVDKVVVPNRGAFAVFLDPTGAALGIWEVHHT